MRMQGIIAKFVMMYPKKPNNNNNNNNQSFLLWQFPHSGAVQGAAIEL